METNLDTKNKISDDEGKVAIVSLIIFAVLAVLNFLTQYFDTYSFLMASAFYFSTGLAAFYGFFFAYKIGFSNFAGKSMFILGIGYFFSFIAYVVWDFYVGVFGIEVPYPSVADLFWILGTPALIIGLGILLKMYKPRIKTRMIFESLGVFIIVSSLFIYYLGWPDLSEATLSSGFFDIFYTVSDAFLFTMALTILRVAGGKIFKGLVLFVIGLFIMVAGDLAFAIRTSSETYFYGDISDLILLIAWIINAAAVYYTAKSFMNSENTNG